ncbi:MAG: tetratricopeptide repeat protein 6 [Bacteroidetes bacterium]|nr:tetratricopeptide repeat protein 6 [Bacteroidota bacterium]
MKLSMKLFFSLLLSLVSIDLISQTSQKYKEIDDLLATKSTVDAMSALNKLKENYLQDTTDSEFWIRYSKAAYIFYKEEEAIFAMDKAVQISPQKAEYYYEKGLLHNRLNKIDVAYEAFDKAVKIAPEGKHYYWRGIMLQRLERGEDAEKDYLKALEDKFETPELYNNLAIINYIQKKYDLAYQRINKALAMNKNYSQAYATRGQIHFYRLNIDSACADLKTAKQMRYRSYFEIPDSVCNGNTITRMRFAAELLALSNNHKAAIDAYTILIENNALKSDYFLNRGFCYFKLKDYVNAEKDYLHALTFPTTASDIIYDNLSLLYFETGNYQKAIEWSTKRIQMNPKNHVAYIDRGLSYRQLKKYKDAEKDYNTSLSIQPDFFRAFGYRASLFLEKGDYTKAFEDASKAIELNPKYGFAYGVLAQAKKQLGHPDYCVDFYKAKEFGEPDAQTAINEWCK